VNAIASSLRPKDICLDLEIADKSQLFDAVGRHMEREHAVPGDWVVQSLSRRERIGSTGVGQGVAIPHARVNGMDRIQALYLRPKSPIPFDAPDGRPVSDVLVLLVPAPASDEHLKLLAEAAQMFSDRRFREHLHACSDQRAVMQLFSSWPETR
jgi:PTS system nitrogen regulatory IIA component